MIRRWRCSCISGSCGGISTCSRWCCRGSPKRRGKRAIRTRSTWRVEELLRQGAGNHAEIAYAAIVSGYYDDPLMLECVREMLTIDSDLRDMAAAFLPAGGDMTREQLRGIAGALRNVVLRHARYKCSECGLDSSTFLWHCPGCHSWDTLRGVAALEFLPRAARAPIAGPMSARPSIYRRRVAWPAKFWPNAPDCARASARPPTNLAATRAIPDRVMQAAKEAQQ